MLPPPLLNGCADSPVVRTQRGITDVQGMRAHMQQYFYLNDGIKQGPFTLEQLAQWPTSREIEVDTLIWFQGISDWTPASELAEFHSILGMPAPEIETTPPDQQDGLPGRLFVKRQANTDNSYSKELASAVDDQTESSRTEALDKDEFVPPPIPRDLVNLNLTRVGSKSMWSAIKNVYEKSFTLKGRATRSEFWGFQLFYYLILFALLVPTMSGVVTLEVPIALFVIGSIPALFSLQIRRIHDLGWSGWWLLLAFIPVIGGTILLIIYLFPSAYGTNKYDENEFHENTRTPPTFSSSD